LLRYSLLCDGLVPTFISSSLDLNLPTSYDNPLYFTFLLR